MSAEMIDGRRGIGLHGSGEMSVLRIEWCAAAGGALHFPALKISVSGVNLSAIPPHPASCSWHTSRYPKEFLALSAR